MDTLSPDERTAANPYSSPVSGERSRARSSSYYAGAPRAHDMSRDSEDEEYDSEYTDLCASDDDEEWLPEMMESGTDSDDAAADGEEQDDDNNAGYEFHGSRIVDMDNLKAFLDKMLALRCPKCRDARDEAICALVSSDEPRASRMHKLRDLPRRFREVKTLVVNEERHGFGRAARVSATNFNETHRTGCAAASRASDSRRIRVIRYAPRGGARGVPGPSVVRWTRSRAWKVRTGIDKHNGLVKLHSTILLFACARVGPSGSNTLRCGILAPTSRSVTKTKTVECNLNSPMGGLSSVRIETAIAGILGPPQGPSGKVARESRIRGVTKLK
jgi:hypothetical protein